MNEPPNQKPMTANDVFWLVLIVFLLIVVGSTMDSCHESWRYRDLRDRLERLEQRP